jgi:periplasmic protein TonB
VRQPPGGTAAYFPPTALQTGVQGSAVINCDIDGDRHLQDCHVVSENPPGLGYGQKALELAHQFTMKPSAAIGARITIPIRFDIPDNH